MVKSKNSRKSGGGMICDKVVDIKGARPDIVFVFQIEYGSGMAFP